MIIIAEIRKNNKRAETSALPHTSVFLKFHNYINIDIYMLPIAQGNFRWTPFIRYPIVNGKIHATVIQSFVRNP